MLSVGVPSIENNRQLVAYPNPTRDFLGVKGLDVMPANEWKIFDLNGKLISEGKSNLSQIDVQNFTSGSYIIRITGTNGQSNEIRFTKN
jgi:hypothetical protein